VDCVFQGVRYVFSSEGQLITSLAQLVDSSEDEYICSSKLHFEMCNYGAMATGVKWSNAYSRLLEKRKEKYD